MNIFTASSLSFSKYIPYCQDIGVHISGLLLINSHFVRLKLFCFNFCCRCPLGIYFLTILVQLVSTNTNIVSCLILQALYGVACLLCCLRLGSLLCKFLGCRILYFVSCCSGNFLDGYLYRIILCCNGSFCRFLYSNLLLWCCICSCCLCSCCCKTGVAVGATVVVSTAAANNAAANFFIFMTISLLSSKM